MRHDARRRLDASLGDGARQGDAPARRLRLEAQHDVGRAGLQAEAAVHAARQVLLARAELVLVVVNGSHHESSVARKLLPAPANGARRGH